jgi:non-homologous end joining protein Ku
VTVEEEQEKPDETTDILEALKASLKGKGKQPTSAVVKRKIGMAMSK